MVSSELAAHQSGFHAWKPQFALTVVQSQSPQNEQRRAVCSRNNRKLCEHISRDTKYKALYVRVENAHYLQSNLFSFLEVHCDGRASITCLPDAELNCHASPQATRTRRCDAGMALRALREERGLTQGTEPVQGHAKTKEGKPRAQVKNDALWLLHNRLPLASHDCTELVLSAPSGHTEDVNSTVSMACASTQRLLVGQGAPRASLPEP